MCHVGFSGIIVGFFKQELLSVKHELIPHSLEVHQHHDTLIILILVPREDSLSDMFGSRLSSSFLVLVKVKCCR